MINIGASFPRDANRGCHRLPQSPGRRCASRKRMASGARADDAAAIEAMKRKVPQL
jgi:hypothetical protein